MLCSRSIRCGSFYSRLRSSSASCSRIVCLALKLLFPCGFCLGSCLLRLTGRYHLHTGCGRRRCQRFNGTDRCRLSGADILVVSLVLTLVTVHAAAVSLTLVVSAGGLTGYTGILWVADKDNRLFLLGRFRIFLSCFFVLRCLYGFFVFHGFTCFLCICFDYFFRFCRFGAFLCFGRRLAFFFLCCGLGRSTAEVLSYKAGCIILYRTLCRFGFDALTLQKGNNLFALYTKFLCKFMYLNFCHAIITS